MRLIFTLLVAAMLTIAVGCEKKKETPPVTPKAPAAGTADAETTSVTFPVEGDLQLVSLKLPAMH